MIINVANPIYDSVFKFLMEDEYFSAIEHRDTELMVKTQKLEEMSEKLTEKDNQLKSMAQVMLANGMSVEVIAQAMGKSAKEILELFGGIINSHEEKCWLYED